MSVRLPHDATECDSWSTDWTTIGARILRMAEVASGLHLIEHARRQRGDASVGDPRGPDGGGGGEDRRSESAGR